jgi:energy-coupling factor transporter ATP-binding protein EcfA2
MPSNLYLLDEPTNHLDVMAREAIESFLTESTATMLVVSHDRRFLETVCERLWVVDSGVVAPFDGRYPAWRQAVTDGWTVAAAIEQEARRLRPRAGVRQAPGPEAGAAADAGSRASAPSRRADRTPLGGSARRDGRAAVGVAIRTPVRARGPKLSKDAYRRQREAVDGELTRLGLRKNHLELSMGDPTVQSNFIELRRVTSELADVEKALVTAEDAWLALEERAP